MGYIILGDKIDTSDWDEHPRKSPQEIVDSVFEQIEEMKTKPWMRGSIILMHDGGGNRQPTVDALPVLIQALRARGYQIVPVCELLGKTRAETMPPLTRKQRWQARIDSMAFSGFAFFNHFVIAVFFVGDVLMSARLIIIGIFAIMDRFRKRKNFATPDYQPSVAVLIPAYNEEKVIVRTIRSVMMSTYKNLRIIVIDDGSTRRHRRGGARSLSGRYRQRPSAGAHQAQLRQGGLAQLRARTTLTTTSTSASTPTPSSRTTPSRILFRTSPIRRSAPSPATPRSATA